MKFFLFILTALVMSGNLARADVILCMIVEGKGPQKEVKRKDGGIEWHSPIEASYKVYGFMKDGDADPQISVTSRLFKNIKIEVTACTSCVHVYNKDGSQKALRDDITTTLKNTISGLASTNFSDGTDLSSITHYEPGPNKRINVNCAIGKLAP